MPFCGHATIATGVAFAERDGAGPRVFHTMAGAVPVQTSGNPVTATLTSVSRTSRRCPRHCSRPR